MNVLLAVAEERSILEALRAAAPESWLLLFERNVEGALRRMVSLQPDVLLIDDAPGLGRAVVPRLRQSAPGIPILALSARSDSESIAAFHLAGAPAVLAKPFGVEAFRETLARLAHKGTPAAANPATTGGTTANASPSGRALAQYQTTLRWIGRLTGQFADKDRLAQGVIDAATDIFNTARCAVVLDKDGELRVVASHGIASHLTAGLRLDFTSGIMRCFEENPCLVERGGLGDASEPAREMQVLGARLAVPLVASARVMGALFVGEKGSGEDYTHDERDLLVSVARAASTCLENAEVYAGIAQRQGQLDTVLAHISAGVIVVGKDKRVQMMNESAARILQVPVDDTVGRSVQRLGSGFTDVVLRTLLDRKPRLRQEVRDAAINATLGLSVTPLGDDGVSVVFSRLPEGHANAEDIAYSPFWEYLASRVAQEIKNPMVAINTFAQLLPKKYDSDEFRQTFSEVAQQEIARINGVVETLFEFARHPRLSLRPNNMNDTVQSVLRSFDDELTSRAIRLEAELDPAATEVSLDPQFFAQALHNVVQNSIEAMPEGGTLRVHTHANGGTCEVIVEDTGPGVPEQDAPLIFMPFFSTKEKGMGLGLTIANRIMRQHDGNLRLVANAEGGGAFVLEVPKETSARAG
mgnify:CR=1 FL=1